jgi:hypothetical protein
VTAEFFFSPVYNSPWGEATFQDLETLTFWVYRHVWDDYEPGEPGHGYLLGQGVDGTLEG